MTDDSILLLEETKEQMENAIAHLEKELSKIRAGKASPDILEGIKIDYYGVLTPINQTANINIPDARTIVIQPWDKSILSQIEKAILAANIGLTPVNNGEIIRMTLPAVTEERRKELVKKAKAEAEQARIAIRNIRRQANEQAKKLEKQGIAEDEIKQLEKEIQELTDKFIEKVDKIISIKEKDIMTI